MVIIEDLDRFEQTEIFTKLRELNLLINNSKKVKRDVTFVYAVRDDMFLDKDRTKFFDFIIPVIPVINASNSNNKLLKIISDNQYPISEDLVDDIGLFIDDMRLLYNITNEYRLYKGLLDDKLSQDKLLSMVVYKNIFPNDFVKLSDRKGDLYEVFAIKSAHVAKLQKQIEDEISQLRSEVNRLAELRITDIKDLRKLYLIHYPKHLKNFRYFMNLDKYYNLDEMTDDLLFQQLITKKLRYHNFEPGQWNGTYATSSDQVNVDFNVIQDEVDPTRSYDQRVAEIANDSDFNIGALRRKIADKEKEKNATRLLKVKDLILKGTLKIELEDKKKSQLLSILMKAGYIDEDYLDYISIFYEGSITKDDQDFLLNVKSQVVTDFDFTLRHIEKLVSKIAINDFDQPYILNYSLLDFLLADDKYKTPANLILQLLKVGSEPSIRFIDGFINVGVNVDRFINQIAKAWPEFWHTINQQNTYSDEQKFVYFDLIVSHCDMIDIERMAAVSTFKKDLLSRQDLLTELTDPEAIESIVKCLNIKFSDVELKGVSDFMVDRIYSNNAYELNPVMLRRLIEAKGIYDESTFDKANYEAILTSNLPLLIEYVNANISEYVQMVYVKLPLNTLEPEDSLLELLNKDNIEEGDIKVVVDRTTCIINDLSESSSLAADGYLLRKQRVKPTWDNVLDHFVASDYILTADIINFLNYLPNAEALSRTLITDSESSINSENLLVISMVKSELIAIENLRLLINSIKEINEELIFEEIGTEQVRIIIDHCLIPLSPDHYNALKEAYHDQHIHLAEINSVDFTASLSEYRLDVNDVLEFIKSEQFDIYQKLSIIKTVESSDLIENSEFLSIAGYIALQYSQFKLPVNILLAILTGSLNTAERIKLFNMNFRDLQIAEVTLVLQNLPYPYSDIAIKGRRPLLPDGTENKYFANNLKSIGYISKRREGLNGIRISTFQK